MMNRYKYIGDLPILQGHTALGQWFNHIIPINDEFMFPGFHVQVDDRQHPWAYFWHRTTFEHWERI